MEEKDQLLIKQHIDHDDELKRCVDEHQVFEKELDELNQKSHLTQEEEIRLKKIKILKLAGRDRIEMILKKYRQP